LKLLCLQHQLKKQQQVEAATSQQLKNAFQVLPLMQLRLTRQRQLRLQLKWHQLPSNMKY
jgi:hypothetical protein